MRILILEDNLERIGFFKEQFKNNKLFIFNNVSEANTFIQLEKIDVFMLDHDLDNKINTVSQEPNTGYQFVNFIVNNELHKESYFYIHSMNACGANNMLNLLKNNGYNAEWFPFALLRLRKK